MPAESRSDMNYASVASSPTAIPSLSCADQKNVCTLSMHHKKTSVPPADRLLSCKTMTAATSFGPPAPSSSHVAHRQSSRVKRKLSLYVVARLLIYLHEREERAEDSYIRGMIRAHFRREHMDRRACFLDHEFKVIYRMSRRAMELLRHELYPYLKTKLSDAQIMGRSQANRRPLTVDEKLGMGLMAAGGCPTGGIMNSFAVGITCAETTVSNFFKSVVLSDSSRRNQIPGESL